MASSTYSPENITTTIDYRTTTYNTTSTSETNNTTYSTTTANSLGNVAFGAPSPWWIVNTPPNIVPIYPQPSVYEYNDYGYLSFILVFLVMLGVARICIQRKKTTAREAQQAARARQRQVPTVSRSVDSNQVVTEPSTNQQVNEDYKIDLPPAYDEAMKSFNANGTSTLSTPNTDNNTSTQADRGSCETIEIDIENLPPPPEYTSSRPT